MRHFKQINFKKLNLFKKYFLSLFLILGFFLVSFQVLSFGTFSVLAQETQLSSQNSEQGQGQFLQNSTQNTSSNSVENPNFTQENTNQNLENTAQSNQKPQDYQFYHIKVIEILEEKKPEFSLVGNNSLNQKLRAVIVGENKEIELEYGVINAIREENKIKVGDELIVSQGFNGEKIAYNVVGFYRIPSVLWIILIFFVVTIWICGRKGFLAIVGLFLSILAIGWWLIPTIIGGFSPFWACVILAVILAVVNLYLAHGFSLRTSVALISVLITLILSAILAPFVASLTHLFGVASEEAFYLQAWQGGTLDLQGLFLGGIIIGTLGVLDDVASSQAATVEEIYLANPDLTLRELYVRGMKVGREHILSMINTLALAYVGVSLPLILSFVIVRGQPWWAIASSDLITEEVVRTLVGSFCLILTVPICNFLAAFVFKSKKTSHLKTTFLK